MGSRAVSRRRALVVIVALAGAALPSRALRAEPAVDAAAVDGSAAAESARRSRVVLRVGSRSVTVGELEDRVAAIPLYQLAEFGGSREAVARAYIDQVLVRDLTLAAGAEQRGLDKELPTKQLFDRALSSATLRRTRIGYASADAIPMDDVRTYYDHHRSRFDAPERINLWRILCSTREQAASVIDAARRDLTIAKFTDLAREHSIDKATNLRGGNLGFLDPDGRSNEAGVKVDAALVKGAVAVKDGELVPQPIAEGANYAVVWRRGTVAAARRSVEEAASQIRSALFRERTEIAERKLIDELRAKHVKEVNDGLLGIVELRPFDAGVGLARSIPSGAPKP